VPAAGSEAARRSWRPCFAADGTVTMLGVRGSALLLGRFPSAVPDSIRSAGSIPPLLLYAALRALWLEMGEIWRGGGGGARETGGCGGGGVLRRSGA
jgi:hypothetical protein